MAHSRSDLPAPLVEHVAISKHDTYPHPCRLVVRDGYQAPITSCQPLTGIGRMSVRLKTVCHNEPQNIDYSCRLSLHLMQKAMQHKLHELWGFAKIHTVGRTVGQLAKKRNGPIRLLGWMIVQPSCNLIGYICVGGKLKKSRYIAHSKSFRHRHFAIKKSCKSCAKKMATLLKKSDHPKFHTSYSLSYTPPPESSIVHYRNFPFLVDPQPESHVTDVTTSSPRGPHRRNTTTEIPPALGLGTPMCFTTFHWSKDKPIVRAPWPQDFSSPEDVRKHASPDNGNGSTEGAPSDHALGAPAGNMIDNICRRSFWDSTSRRAGKEYALPVPSAPKPTTTLEADADSARLRPKRYDARPGAWQTFSTQWDRVQLRDSASAAERMTL